jgi:hypothetical protein
LVARAIERVVSHLHFYCLSRSQELTNYNYVQSTEFCPYVIQPLVGLEVQLPDSSAATLGFIHCDLCGLPLVTSKFSLLGTCSSLVFHWWLHKLQKGFSSSGVIHLGSRCGACPSGKYATTPERAFILDQSQMWLHFCSSGPCRSLQQIAHWVPFVGGGTLTFMQLLC